MSKLILVSNIVRYAIHDGHGLRTTVFLKGCTLHCPWCANPETINQHNEWWFRSNQCIGTENGCAFQNRCNRKVAFEKAGKSVKDESDIRCPIGALVPVAKAFDSNELYYELMKDKPFWGKEGGVTFSGGEPLLQFEAIQPVLTELKQNHINIAFETAGCIPTGVFTEMLQYADWVYLDIKNVVSEEASKITGADIETYLSNLNFLDSSGVGYCLRMPLIKPYTYSCRNIERVCNIVSRLRTKKIEIFSCHNLGSNKWKWLGKKMQIVSDPDEKEMIRVTDALEKVGADVKILKMG